MGHTRDQAGSSQSVDMPAIALFMLPIHHNGNLDSLNEQDIATWIVGLFCLECSGKAWLIAAPLGPIRWEQHHHISAILARLSSEFRPNQVPVAIPDGPSKHCVTSL